MNRFIDMCTIEPQRINGFCAASKFDGWNDCSSMVSENFWENLSWSNPGSAFESGLHRLVVKACRACLQGIQECVLLTKRQSELRGCNGVSRGRGEFIFQMRQIRILYYIYQMRYIYTPLVPVLTSALARHGALKINDVCRLATGNQHFYIFFCTRTWIKCMVFESAGKYYSLFPLKVLISAFRLRKTK